MTSVSLTEAKARLSELVDTVSAGNSVSITRRGKPVAKLTAANPPRKPIDPAQMRAVTDPMPMQAESASIFVRKVRDEDRY